MKVPPSTHTFEYTNPHPKGIKDIGDCVFRSISIATEKPWLEIYDELTALGRELLAPPNDTKVYTKYLDKIASTATVKKNNRMMSANEIALMYPQDTIVIRQAGHLVAVKDGKIRDTWNSGSRKAYKAWIL